MYDALDTSRREFERRLPLIAPADWDRPTPCTEWDVRALVNHVVGGCRRYTLLLSGATADETNELRSQDHIGDDVVESFRAAADEMGAPVRAPGALERTVDHPAGPRPGAVLLGMRIIDFTVHAWDLFRGIAADDRLDGPLVEWCVSVLAGLGPSLAQGGYFQPPPGEPSAGASAQDELLRITGRTA